MPLIKPGMRKPPKGFEEVRARLEELDEQMRRAVQDDSTNIKIPTRGKRPRDEMEGAGAATAAGSSGSETETETVPPLWRVARINFERTRHVYEAAFVPPARVPKEVFDYCCEMQLIDAGLARRWRLSGYERLCCVACAVPGGARVAAAQLAKYASRGTREHRETEADARRATQQTCVCRVPAHQRMQAHFTRCAVCGCPGCASSDVVRAGVAKRALAATAPAAAPATEKGEATREGSDTERAATEDHPSSS